MFIVSFATIQFWEGILWLSPRDSSKSTEVGRIIVPLILLTLLSQPIAQTYGAYKTSSKAGKKNDVLRVSFYIAIALFLWGLYEVLTKSFSYKVGENGHLVWEKNSTPGLLNSPSDIIGILYLIGLFLPLLWMEMKYAIPLLLVGAATFIFSMSRTRKTGEFSSYWCYTAVLYSLVCLLI